MTDEPKLMYFKETGEFKGDILLDEKVTVEAKDSSCFILTTPVKSYKIFAGKDGESAVDWVEAIQAAKTAGTKNFKQTGRATQPVVAKPAQIWHPPNNFSFNLCLFLYQLIINF